MTHARLAIVLWLMFARAAAAQSDPLGPVRELYAGAAYEEALSAVSRIKADAKPALAGLELDRYRAMCLIALGRTAEAETVIEGIVTAAPLYQLTPTDASPRVRAVFATVRRRVLPTLIRPLYAEAKSAFDRKAYAEAAEKLSQTLRVIDDPDARDHPDLTDLRTLASGFLDLSRASLAPPSPSSAPRAAPVDSAASRHAAVPPPSDPVVIRQDVPPWSRAIGGALYDAEFKGAIEVDIDERGDVVAARIVDSIHPTYDPILLKAARSWKYRPARRSGNPVPALKRVDVLLRPR
jgi:hypothetical protein